jgi:Domain of unknown function (DUF4465)
MKKHLLLCGAYLTAIAHALASQSTFDDLGLSPNSHENGANLAGSFNSGGLLFNNDYTPAFGGLWSGFAYSNRTDTVTPGLPNQYSAFTGGGSDPTGATVAGGAYGLGFISEIPTITLPLGETPASLRVTNTTYAALSMRDGDSFAKKFGGPTGNDPDFFKLTITGLGAGNTILGSVDFYLADFRFANNAQDYILSSWTEVNVSTLGAATQKLQFALTSSDNGMFGMNTPAYFAIDNVKTVPEPAGATLFAMGLAGLVAIRRRR